MVLYILFLLSSLLHIATCTVYTVTPDDHYYPNTTCHHCHNLQHYLLNITKYFTSNTQLLFLPGLHHLYTDLIIQNVHNISLIGSTANGTTLDTVIQCNSSVGIVMTNITNLIVSNFVIKGCKKSQQHVHGVNQQVAVSIENCSDIILRFIHIHMEDKDILHTHSLLGINVLGKSKLVNFSCNKIILYYDDIQARNIKNTLLIDHFQRVEYVNTFLIIDLMIYHHLYEITIQLAHITLQHQHEEFLRGILSNSILYITNCQFLTNRFSLFNIKVPINNDYGSIKFINCKFLNNSNSTPLINIDINVTIISCTFNGGSIIQLHEHDSYENNKNFVLIKNTRFIDCKYSELCSLIDTDYVDIIIVNCIFNGNQSILNSHRYNANKNITVVIQNTQFNCNYLNNTNLGSLINARNVDVIIVNCSFNGRLNILDIYGYGNNVTIVNCSFNGSLNALRTIGYFIDRLKVTVIIKNTQFVNSLLTDQDSLLTLFFSNLILEGVVTFHAITNHDSIIELYAGSTITIHGGVKFSNNTGRQLISFIENSNQYIKIKDPSIISIHHNQVCNFFVMSTCEETLYQFCIFQYYTNGTLESGNFLIEYYNNQLNFSIWKCYICYIPITNCNWLPQSAFYHVIPNDVNTQFIKYINNSDVINVNSDHDTLCACNNQMNHDCSINDFRLPIPW